MTASPDPPRGHARSRVFVAVVLTVVFVTLAVLGAIIYLEDVTRSIGDISQGVRDWWENAI